MEQQSMRKTYKYVVSGNRYTIRVPAPAADTRLAGVWQETTFVDDVRVCCRWSGLPELERAHKTPTRERGVLTRDLLPL
jgi:hypothetical protein